MRRIGRIAIALLTLIVACLVSLILASPASALSSHQSAARSDVLGCKAAPTPEVPGRGMVGFFESTPDTLPPAGNPFAAGQRTTSIYEQYGYAGLRFNTYDLGCGPDLALSPDASVGTAVANWLFNLPKTAIAATGAIVGQAFAPDFLSFFDPLISTVVDGLQHAVFDQWFGLVIAALGVLLIWKARQASLASSASAIGWALLVMVLVTMVFRWPLVAGHAADETVTSTLGQVNRTLNGDKGSADGNPGSTAVAGLEDAVLYRSWLGGTLGDADSPTAKLYGPQLFDSQALTWREANILQTDPAQGAKIIAQKEAKFQEVAAEIQAQDPDAYEYLTGRRSDSRVGYAMLASLAALCAVPFLLMSGLLVLGALVIVRFGVMLFPAIATLGLFPTMRSLVTGIGSTVASALINAVIFGIGASVTILGMGVLLSPGIGAAWLQIVLMLLLTVVMWVALSPFRRLTQMVSNRHPFAGATAGIRTATAARSGGRILSGAIGTFLGATMASRANEQHERERAPDGVPQRAEATTIYHTVVYDDAAAPRGTPAALGAGAQAGTRSGTQSGTQADDHFVAEQRRLQVSSPVTMAGRRAELDDFGPDDIYTPGTRAKVPERSPGPASARAEGGRGRQTAALTGGFESGRFESGASASGRDASGRDLDDAGVPIGRASRRRPIPPERREAATVNDQLRDELERQSDGGIDELSEIFEPSERSRQ